MIRGSHSSGSEMLEGDAQGAPRVGFVPHAASPEEGERRGEERRGEKRRGEGRGGDGRGGEGAQHTSEESGSAMRQSKRELHEAGMAG